MTSHNVLDSLLALVASVFDAYSVVLFLPEDGGTGRLAASFSMGDAIRADAMVEPGKGLVGWILRKGEPLLINAMDQSQPYLGYYHEGREPDIRAFMGCPVPGGGALCIDSRKNQAFEDSKPKLLHLFALLLPQILAGGGARESESAAFFKTLARMADLRASYKGWGTYLKQVLPMIMENGGFDYVAFVSRAEGSQEYTLEGEYPELLGTEASLPVSSGIAGWVLRNEEAVHYEGLKGSTASPIFGKVRGMPDFACAVCLPVQVEKSTCGALCLAAFEGRVLSEDMRSFIRLAADDFSRLLEHVALRYKIKRLLPRASLHHDGPLRYDPDQAHGTERD